MRLIAAANVEVPAYLEILRHGYKVTKSSVSNGSESWQAKNGHDIYEADSPLKLLGVITIGESRGELWRANDIDIDAFLRKYYPESHQD